jgi:hypothetical protein
MTGTAAAVALPAQAGSTWSAPRLGAAATFPATDVATVLVIDPGHAVLISSGAGFTERVSRPGPGVGWPPR